MSNSLTLPISVVIPTYNYAHYIHRCITSIVRQLYTVQEIIVIDDGSTDNTKEIIQSAIHQFVNYNIQYWHQDNHGVSAARNYGFTLAMSSYTLFLDADDELLPNASEILKLAINENIDSDMIFCGYTTFSHKGSIKYRIPEALSLNRPENVAKLLSGKIIGLRPSTTIIKRHVLEKIKFSENIYVDEDTVFFCHVFAKFKCVSIPEMLVKMTRHTDSLRGNYQRILETGTNGIEDLFSSMPNIQNKDLLIKHSLLKRYLKIARAACINRDYKTAAKHYTQAFNLEPCSIFTMKHFVRTVKSQLLQYLIKF